MVSRDGVREQVSEEAVLVHCHLGAGRGVVYFARPPLDGSTLAVGTAQVVLEIG